MKDVLISKVFLRCFHSEFCLIFAISMSIITYTYIKYVLFKKSSYILIKFTTKYKIIYFEMLRVFNKLNHGIDISRHLSYGGEDTKVFLSDQSFF